MRTIILIIVLTALQFSLKAQVTEEYINSDPCMLFPSKYKRLSDSISKTPIDEISAIYIREYFRNQFLDFRMTETPGIPDSIKTYPTDIIGYTHYKNPKKVMLPDSINNLDLDMEVTMNRWPLDKPLPGFFLIEKEKNRFIHRNYYRKPHVIEKDVTLDIYDSLYLFDRYFLIYYYNWTNEYRGEETYNISGNLHYNTGHTEQWEKYICSDNWMMYARAAMYGVKEMPEWFSMGKENNILYNYFSAQASEIGNNHIMIRSNNRFPKFNYDIIFFSNEQRFTNDSNKAHIYEIVFSTREVEPNGWPVHSRKYEDLLPKRSTLVFDMNMVSSFHLAGHICRYLQKKYDIGQIPYVSFFNGDISEYEERDKTMDIEPDSFDFEPILDTIVSKIKR